MANAPYPGSHAQGPLTAGTLWEGAAPNWGYAVLAQTGTITQNSTAAVSLTFKVPANSQLLDFLIDLTTAYDSGTSATLSIGITAGGTEYVSGVDVKVTAGRLTPTYTGTQLAAMANVGSNLSVIATVTVVGTTTAGVVRITPRYVQK